jgi:hypothetical membrane protein
MTSRISTLGSCAAVVCLISTVYFLAAASAAQLLNPHYNFVRDYISDYAIGRWGWIYGSAFWASGIGTFGLAILLTQVTKASALLYACIGMLVVAGMTYVVDYYFPTDILSPGASPVTLVGATHFAAALIGWVLFTLAAVLISSRLKQGANWAHGWTPLFSLALLLGVLLVVMVAVLVSKAPYGGLAEKAFILVRNVWALAFCVLALRAGSNMISTVTE